MKKSVKITIIVAACVAVLCIAFGVFFALFTFVGGDLISTGVTELDLSDMGLADVSGLKRCRKLETLDLRGNEISAAQFDELQAALPDCEILWSVPIGMERYDSNISEFSIAADYVEDLYNIRYFTDISSCDVSGTSADDERLYDLNMSIDDIVVYWTVTINGEEYKTNIEELDLSKAKLTDTTFIKYFTELKSLTLPPYTFEDISILEGLVKLEYLDISRNNIADISALAGLTELRELNLAETYSNDGIKDLTPLGSLAKLEVLNLNQCSGANYEVLVQLPVLRELDLEYFGDHLTDYSFIGELASLEKLNLTYSGILSEDVKYLESLSELKYLNLTGIYVTDPSPLYSLNNLEELIIEEAGVILCKDEFLDSLSNCDISWA